jgi:integrase
LIADYKVWRLNFWKRRAKGDVPANVKTKAKQSEHYGTPSPNTLNRENPTLRQILAYAAKRGCFSGKAVPTVPTEAAKPNPRPAFLGGDFEKLAAEAEKWIEEARDETQRHRRQLLADWIWVGRHTGLRLPHEAEKLTWGDVRLDVNILHVSDDTKTGKREVPLNPKATQRLRAMRERRMDRARKAAKKFNAAEHVFVLEDGAPFGSLPKLFNELVARCEFPARADDAVYSPYCLRHTFATFALAEGMTSDHVAEIMGCSVKMIKDHYKHGTIEQLRRYLERQGLLASSRNVSPQDRGPSLIEPLDELPEGDWRNKQLALTPGGQLVVVHTPAGSPRDPA